MKRKNELINEALQEQCNFLYECIKDEVISHDDWSFVDTTSFKLFTDIIDIYAKHIEPTEDDTNEFNIISLGTEIEDEIFELFNKSEYIAYRDTFEDYIDDNFVKILLKKKLIKHK